MNEEFKLIETSKNIAELPLFIDETPAISIAALSNRARRIKRKYNLDLIIIDYISNFWQTENEYTAFLYEKKPSDRFYKIIGYANKNSLKIVN